MTPTWVANRQNLNPPDPDDFWILTNGVWNDEGIWKDTEEWED